MLEHCRVVLVGPMFGGNVGASARAIKNTGLAEMHLVAPTFEDHNEAKKFSHGAEEVLEGAVVHSELLPAISDAERVVGFTVRERHRREMKSCREFAESWVQDALSGPLLTALLFGRERDGLKNEELDLCTDLVWIPSHPAHPSYNLAQAVLLAGYELLCARDAADANAPVLKPRQTKKPPPSPVANAEELDAMLQHLRESFLSIGYAYPHTVDPMIRSWHEVFSRARLQQREAAMIRGLAQQVLWAAEYLPEGLKPE